MNNMTAYEDIEKLMAIQFYLVELNLFLDTHPDDQKALADFNEMVKYFDVEKKRFESMYGPLVNFGHGQSKSPWQWAQAPWPWEMS